MEYKISIIVPVYNAENYVENCIQSIQQQTYSNLEIIIVNDGSSDMTGEIVDNIALIDRRIKVIYQKNAGVTAARINGIKHATGEYIGFVDGDDYIEPDMYQHLLENALKYQADISHCGYQKIFPDGKIEYYYKTNKLIEQNHLKGLADLLTGLFIEPGLCNKLFKKEIIDKIDFNCIDISIRQNEDFLMNFFIFNEAKNSVYEDFCPYHYIVRENSATTADFNEYQLKDPLKVLRIIYKNVWDNRFLKEIIEKRIVGRILRVIYMSFDNEKEFVKEYRDNMRNSIRKNIFSIVSKKHYGFKIKILSICAVLAPDFLSRMYHVYRKIKYKKNLEV